jgi:hypothetical protein
MAEKRQDYSDDTIRQAILQVAANFKNESDGTISRCVYYKTVLQEKFI